jgi:oligoribonuclease NrnB/cAMP/cGMP phosphodiesterase (DHH superfamily)
MRRVQGSLQFKIWAVRNYDEMRELPEAAVKKMFDNMSFENIQETDDEVQKVLQMKPTGG